MPVLPILISLCKQAIPIELKKGKCRWCRKTSPHLVLIIRYALVFIRRPILPIFWAKRAKCLNCSSVIPEFIVRNWPEIPVEDYERVILEVAKSKIRERVPEFDVKLCDWCNRPVRFITQFNRYYCDYCRIYLNSQDA